MPTPYPFAQQPLPSLTTEQMIDVDRAMIEDYHIQLIQMMENAGRNLAHLARARFLDGNPARKSVLVMAGPGGNGGGALVCARHLHNMGANVQIAVSRAASDFTPIPAHQLAIIKRMGLTIHEQPSLLHKLGAELILDGIIGYSLQGAPHGTSADLIELANQHPAPILALDVPSGLDGTTGQPYLPTIQAAATMTLALPKVGLWSIAAEEFVGEIYLANISVPPDLYAKSLGISVPSDLFATHDIVQLR